MVSLVAVLVVSPVSVLDGAAVAVDVAGVDVAPAVESGLVIACCGAVAGACLVAAAGFVLPP